MEQGLLQLWASTGLYNFTLGQALMIAVGGLLIFLAINKGFEPLLLIPIGFGGILANIPIAEIAGPDGLLGILYHAGIETGVFPLLGSCAGSNVSVNEFGILCNVKISLSME